MLVIELALIYLSSEVSTAGSDLNFICINHKVTQAVVSGHPRDAKKVSVTDMELPACENGSRKRPLEV